MSDTFICAYALNGDGSGSALDEAGLASRSATDKPVWVHLSARSAEARRWLEKDSQLPDETLIDALLAEDTRPRMQIREEGVLLILRGVNLNDNAEPEDMVSIRIWIDNDRFISVQLRTLRGVEDMQQRLESGVGPTDIGDLVTSFIEGSIVRMSPVMGDLADGIDELEDRILQMDLSGIREQIISTRRQAIIFNRFLAPQRDLVQRLIEASISWLDEDDIPRLQEAQRLPQHRAVFNFFHVDFGKLQMRQRILRTVQAVFHCHLDPRVIGRFGTAHILANDRREVTTRTGIEVWGKWLRVRQRPHGIGF